MNPFQQFGCRGGLRRRLVRNPYTGTDPTGAAASELLVSFVSLCSDPVPPAAQKKRTEGSEGNEGSMTRINSEVSDLGLPEEFCLTPHGGASQIKCLPR